MRIAVLKVAARFFYEISSDDNFCKTVVYDINDCCNNIRANILCGDFSCTRDTEIYSKLNAYFSSNTVKF